MLIPSVNKSRMLGTMEDRMGLQARAELNKPSRLATLAAGRPVGMSYIPELNMDDMKAISTGGGAQTMPQSMDPHKPVQTSSGKKIKRDDSKARIFGS